MQEAEIRWSAQVVPQCQRRAQQMESPHHVGLQKCLRAGNRAVNMALGSKMQNRPRPVALQHPGDRGGIAQVNPLKVITRVLLQSGKVRRVARIGQRIQIDHRLLTDSQPVADEVGTDKSATTCYQNHPNTLRVLKGRGLSQITRPLSQPFTLQLPLASSHYSPSAAPASSKGAQRSATRTWPSSAMARSAACSNAGAWAACSRPYNSGGLFGR